MFVINRTDRSIVMSRGDTGWIPFRITGAVLGSNDRAVFTMKNSQGVIVKEAVFTPVSNVFWVRFVNSDTDGLPAGIYNYDVRVVIGPTYNPQTGAIVDGQEVKTPMMPANITLVNTVGEI